MKRNGVKRGTWGLLVLALLALGLAGCGGDEPAPVVQPPAPPPAPPPFQPEPVEVTLGTSGSKVTLMTAEGGGFTLDGEPFEGGNVAAENGNEYTLALADGTWTATYIPVEVPVELGTSGATLIMMRGEDGSFSIGGGEGVISIATAPDGSPQGALAANGNQYALALADGEWTATYIMPPAVSVALGMSGESVMVSKMEDGSYAIGDMAIMEGSEVMAANGNGYSLSMASGAWAATYMPTHEMVRLGITGEMATVQKEEDGSYTLNGMAVMSGSTTMSSNGNTYTLTMDDAGMWSAAYTPPEPTMVPLGTSGGSITLLRNEDQTYSLISQSMVSGLQANADGSFDVTASNGNGYTVSMDDDGMWRAMYVEPGATTLPLGTSGSNVNIDKNEDGSYSIGDDTIADGSVVQAGNGNEYRLTMVGSMWTAEYVPVHSAVMLGASGESATLTRAEDGSYWLGDMAVQDGSTTMASNGNTYMLSMGDDGWMATFVEPDPMAVALGASGNSVMIRMTEDRTYWIGDAQIMSGDTYEMGGNKYTLSMDDAGMWSAMYMGEESMVALGTSGTTITLVKQEDGSYAMDGSAFASGMTVAADNGDEYTVSMDADGMWSAMYVAATQTVTLGISGTVTLTRTEDGMWMDGDMAVMSGDTLTASNGNRYLVSQDSEGTFTATYQPVTMAIQGTGLTASAKEDGSGYSVNGGSLGSSGTGDITVDGAKYHVWMDGSTMTGARYDDAIHGDSAGDVAAEAAFVIVGDLRMSGHLTAATDDDRGSNLVPTLSADDEDTVGNELRTSLSIAGQTFSIADLLGSGTATDKGDTFVSVAHDAISKIRGDVAALLALDSPPTNLATILDGRWAAIQTEVDKVFGAGEVTVTEPSNNDNQLTEIDEILTALSNGTSFAAATKEDGGGVFEDVALSEADALDAFDAADAEASVTFGATGPTRYGALSVMTRPNATADLDYNWGTQTGSALGNGDTGEQGLVGAFSYSTIDDVQRVHHITHTGNAYYEGETVAVSGTGAMYTGDIAIQVRFASEKVSGLVTNLVSAAGEAWTYQYGNAESIILPTASNLSSVAHWSATAADSTAANAAQVTFAQRAGSTAPQKLGGTFQGQLLGRGDDSGSHAHGTWSVGAQTASGSPNYLAGAFGAERKADAPTTRPGQDDGSVHETIVTSNTVLDTTDNVFIENATPPNAFKLDSGDLVVTMNKTARYKEGTASTVLASGTTNEKTVLGTTDAPTLTGSPTIVIVNGADDTLLVDTDTVTDGNQFPTEDLKLSLATMVANAQAEQNVNGGKKQREIFVAALETLRADLVLLQSLDTRITASEQTVWSKVQQATLRIFHYVPEKVDDAYDEDDALGLIDQMLYAFESQANLAAALDRDGKGIFNNVTKSDAVGEPSASLIWGRQEAQLKVQGASTDYTRWGVWRVRGDRYAARDGWDNYEDDDLADGNEPGSFAYSALTPTIWADEDDPGFPGGGSALFTGGTTAIVNTTIFEGTAEVHVAWLDTWDPGTQDNVGTATLRLKDLITTANGDALTPAGSTTAVSLVTFESLNITKTADNHIVINATGATPTTSGGAFGLTPVSATTSGSSVAARFLGQDTEGPLAVIGSYSINGFGIGTGSTSALVGAFGAERP